MSAMKFLTQIMAAIQLFSPEAEPTAQRMAELSYDVSEFFKDDPTRAGLVFAWVDGKHYLSIVRYTEQYGKGKEVVLSTEHEYMDIAICNLTERWEAVKPTLLTKKGKLKRKRDELDQNWFDSQANEPDFY